MNENAAAYVVDNVPTGLEFFAIYGPQGYVLDTTSMYTTHDHLVYRFYGRDGREVVRSARVQGCIPRDQKLNYDTLTSDQKEALVYAINQTESKLMFETIS